MSYKSINFNENNEQNNNSNNYNDNNSNNYDDNNSNNYNDNNSNNYNDNNVEEEFQNYNASNSNIESFSNYKNYENFKNKKNDKKSKKSDNLEEGIEDYIKYVYDKIKSFLPKEKVKMIENIIFDEKNMVPLGSLLIIVSVILFFISITS